LTSSSHRVIFSFIICGSLHDQASGQDGWIFAYFLFTCLWTETESRSVHQHVKTERGQTSYLDYIRGQTSHLVNKRFIIEKSVLRYFVICYTCNSKCGNLNKKQTYIQTEKTKTKTMDKSTVSLLVIQSEQAWRAILPA